MILLVLSAGFILWLLAGALFWIVFVKKGLGFRRRHPQPDVPAALTRIAASGGTHQPVAPFSRHRPVRVREEMFN